MTEQPKANDLLPSEFSRIEDSTGKLIGLVREIPGSYFPDGRQRFMMFSHTRHMLGMARSVEYATACIASYAAQWSDWVKVPFVKKEDPVSL